jgi:hypothetical protein
LIEINWVAVLALRCKIGVVGNLPICSFLLCPFHEISIKFSKKSHGNFLRIFVFVCTIFHVFKLFFELISRSKSSCHSPRRTDAAACQTCSANDAQARHLSYALDNAVIFFLLNFMPRQTRGFCKSTHKGFYH